MNQHVGILGALYIIFNFLALIVASGVFLIIAGAGILSGDAEAFIITSTVGFLIGLFLAVTSLPGIIAGIALLRRREWGRILTLILGVLNLINLPFGTLLGVYTIWVLTHHETIEIFQQASSVPA